MSRKRTQEQNVYPYHVTGRCINREWFRLPMQQVWEIFEEQLFLLQRGFDFQIHAFVLMSNHFHLLVSTPKNNLSDGMRYFMKETGRQINYESNRINQVWGGRFFRSMITSTTYYQHAYKYVYRNPIEATEYNHDVLSYQYSTLPGILGFRKLIFTIDDNTLFDMGIEDCLQWLNTMPEKENIEAVQKGLKKSVFNLGKCRKTKREFVINIY